VSCDGARVNAAIEVGDEIGRSRTSLLLPSRPAGVTIVAWPARGATSVVVMPRAPWASAGLLGDVLEHRRGSQRFDAA